MVDEGEPEVGPLAMAYKVLDYPKLGMRLCLGASYTRAELETRCGRKHPQERRKLLYKKLQDTKLFKPVTLKAALAVKKVHVKQAEWVRPPAVQRQSDDIEEVQRRRLVANVLAAEMLRKAGDEGAIRDSDVLSCLRAWGFSRNSARKNVLPEGSSWVLSDTLGLNRGRDGRTVLTGKSRQYPEVTRLLMRWLCSNRPGLVDEDFPCTSISVNSSYAARRHRDRNNAGPSLLRCFGTFSGGNLRYWPEDDGTCPVKDLTGGESIVLKAKKSTVVFDGRRAHEVTNFQGRERFSLVFFTLGKYWQASSQTQQQCMDLGFSWPTSGGIRRAMSSLS